MLFLDHITVIAPTLEDGVQHVRGCLDIDVPFGTRHTYMGTHNHRLQLGNRVYLEIVSRDPVGTDPGRPRWFGLDNQARVRADWDNGRRLRGWVASSTDITSEVTAHPDVFGEVVALPPARTEFAFSIPSDGTLPMDGAAPSLIDHRGDPTSMADIPELGAQLVSFAMQHPNPERINSLYDDLDIDRPPLVTRGPNVRFSARIETSTGLRELT